MTTNPSQHRLKCAEQIRCRALQQAGDPLVPDVGLLHQVAETIHACCGHTRLKSHRLAWGWTLAEALEAFHVMCEEQKLDRRGLGQRGLLGWEAGGLPDDDYRDRLCRLYRTNPVRLGFSGDYTPPGAEAGADAIGRGATVGDELDVVFARSASDAMEFTRRAEASDIGPRTLEQLDLVVDGLARAYAHTPPRDMFPTAIEYRQRVEQLLEGRLTLRQRRELFRHAGWLSTCLGWLCHDLGDPVAARAHLLDAWEHGWQADDGEICGWAMDATATIAMYGRDLLGARDAAAKGLAVVPDMSAARVRLSCQLTRAYGCLRDADGFDTALADTRDLLERLPEPGVGLFSADAGRIESYAATSSIRLDRPGQAVAHARSALDYYAKVGAVERAPTREAIARLDLAMAHAATGAPDGAVEEAIRALESERITSSVLSRTEDLCASLGPQHSALAAVRDLLERCRSLSARRKPQLTRLADEPPGPPAAHRATRE